MQINAPLSVKNYKCFGTIPQGFQKIQAINIIIGKNNSGKSSLLDLIKYVIYPQQEFISTGRDKTPADVIIEDKVTVDQVQSAFEGQVNQVYVDSYKKKFPGKEIKYLLMPSNQKELLSFEESFSLEIHRSFLLAKVKHPLQGKILKSISAERDIKPEGIKDQDLKVLQNGDGATNLIYQIVYQSKNDPFLISKLLLNELNAVLNPDIYIAEILPRHTQSGTIEIYFVDRYKNVVALSKMGSGIKTVLLTLLNLLIIPIIEKTHNEEIVFCFEEIENNLHAALQRRLFNYIAKYAIENKSYFFITTHSSIVIDLFSRNNNAQIIHVVDLGGYSISKTVINNDDGRNILKDLDIKASDILLNNGVIWLEGPSDIIYLEMLYELYKKKTSITFSEGIDFCFQCLATAIWKYVGFKDFDWNDINDIIENKIISLAKINHNHLIILDKDNNYDDKKPSEWQIFSHGTGQNKAKLIYESMKFSKHKEDNMVNNFGDSNDNKLFFWINDGTFETYLKHFISSKGKDEFQKFFDISEARGYFEKKRGGEDSSISKVELASKIAKFSLENNLSFEDFAPANSPLESKIFRLYNTIKSWK